MLSISGEKKMYTNFESSDTESHSDQSPISGEKIYLNKNNDRKILGSVPNNLSNKEKVERLIQCMKRNQEMKNLSKGKDEDNSVKDYKNTGASFQNRFLAQKNIIDVQRTRLLEQEKIINELKMGILSNEDTRKNDKYDISELFHDCKMKLIGKIPLDYISKNRELLVKTQKAPKIIQELQERALERIKYREIIKERKQQLLDAEKKLKENSRKQQMEEDEKMKHLEMLKERHRKEQQRMKIRQKNKEIFLKKWNRAVIFYEKKLLRRIFSRWKSNYVSFLDNWQMSAEYYRQKILKIFFSTLKNIVHSKYLLKCGIADVHHRKLLLKKTWKNLRENHMEGIRSWQVAEDFNDFRIERTVLRNLFSYTSKEKVLRGIKIQQACYHHRRKLIFSSFFHWKSLPMVLKMERAKEERKQKWRKKVLEILPDFNPSEICDELKS